MTGYHHHPGPDRPLPPYGTPARAAATDMRALQRPATAERAYHLLRLRAKLGSTERAARDLPWQPSRVAATANAETLRWVIEQLDGDT